MSDLFYGVVIACIAIVLTKVLEISVLRCAQYNEVIIKLNGYLADVNAMTKEKLFSFMQREATMEFTIEWQKGYSTLGKFNRFCDCNDFVFSKKLRIKLYKYGETVQKMLTILAGVANEKTLENAEKIREVELPILYNEVRKEIIKSNGLLKWFKINR